MENIIEYFLYFVLMLLSYLHQIYEFRSIEKPKNRPEFVGAVILLIILTIGTRVVFSKMIGDDYVLTHTLNKIINLYVNP